ncbi:hypothetical protein AA103196_2437 [Ameyamaea chiangmaiensis NBRC 103196]|nr:hypothetical protein AA103196_2437 [Ameyamaea chiangmaiensis NBRC 103196]
MQVNPSSDGQGAVLQFLEGSGIEGEIPLSLDQLSQLIESLGRVRTALVANHPVPPIQGATFQPVLSTRWALQPEALTEGSLFAYQHPAYGPVGLVLSPDDAEQIIKGLQRHRAMMHHSPNTPSRPS